MNIRLVKYEINCLYRSFENSKFNNSFNRWTDSSICFEDKRCGKSGDC